MVTDKDNEAQIAAYDWTNWDRFENPKHNPIEDEPSLPDDHPHWLNQDARRRNWKKRIHSVEEVRAYVAKRKGEEREGTSESDPSKEEELPEDHPDRLNQVMRRGTFRARMERLAEEEEKRRKTKQYRAKFLAKKRASGISFEEEQRALYIEKREAALPTSRKCPNCCEVYLNSSDWVITPKHVVCRHCFGKFFARSADGARMEVRGALMIAQEVDWCEPEIVYRVDPKKFRRYRESRRLSQERLSTLSGLSRGKVRGLDERMTVVTPKEFEAILKAFAGGEHRVAPNMTSAMMKDVEAAELQLQVQRRQEVEMWGASKVAKVRQREKEEFDRISDKLDSDRKALAKKLNERADSFWKDAPAESLDEISVAEVARSEKAETIEDEDGEPVADLGAIDLESSDDF